MQFHRHLLALTLLALLPACTTLHQAPCKTTPAASSGAANPSPTQAPFINAHALIIIRHADIDLSDKKSMGSNAHLTPRGEQRAKELAYALKDAGITRILTSDTLRTQETAATLAHELHLPLEKPFSHGSAAPLTPATALPPTDYGNAKKKEAASVLAYLASTAKPSDTLLLIHHHSVIPDLLRLLTAHAEPPFNEPTEFDRLYVILPNPTTHTYQILRLRYGGTWEPAKSE